MTILIDGKCPCGHEVDPGDTNICLIPDADGVVHRVRNQRGTCDCHGTDLSVIEFGWERPKASSSGGERTERTSDRLRR